ncbi:MAG: TraR/DksA family transcriptional regulator [Bacteroidetes bacterium]|nr:TraR/DksA family transcriptional regulator [Bacteroidota bacterium]
MAVKKKPTPKKNTKPAASKKPVAKKAPVKAAKPAVKKPAPKKAAPAKAPVKKAAPAKPAAKKPASKKAVPVKPVAKKVVAAKPVAKKPAPAKPASKPVVSKAVPAKPVAAKAAPLKPAPAPAPKLAPVPPPPPMPKKGDPLSLVSIKAKVKPVTKKEPPKPTKVVIPKTTTKSAVKYEPDFTKSILDANRAEAAQTGPTQRYSDSDLAEFKEIIMRKLDAAKKELNYLQGLITRKDEGGDMDDARYMTMEDGSVSMEREQLSQMASRQITFIDHLEKALMRIENKTYGICRVTGKLIDKARLRAVPHATLSIEAKQMMNR